MDGNAAAEAFITRCWVPDSNNSCPLCRLEEIGRQTAVPLKTIRYWLFVNGRLLSAKTPSGSCHCELIF
jgi:hypothetical protein